MSEDPGIPIVLQVFFWSAVCCGTLSLCAWAIGQPGTYDPGRELGRSGGTPNRPNDIPFAGGSTPHMFSQEPPAEHPPAEHPTRGEFEFV